MIVASGLAVGVFSGLLLVRGTGEAAEESGGGPDVPTVVDAGAAKPADAAVAVNVVDAAPPVVDAAPEPDEPKTATLTFEVSPGDVDDLEITVNDAKVEGTTHEVELGESGEKRVKIIAKADGYRPFTKRLKVQESETVEISLRKRSSGGGSSRPRPTGPKGPGGLIDLP